MSIALAQTWRVSSIHFFFGVFEIVFYLLVVYNCFSAMMEMLQVDIHDGDKLTDLACFVITKLFIRMRFFISIIEARTSCRTCQ